METCDQIVNDSAVFRYLKYVSEKKLSVKDLEVVKTFKSDWLFEEERENIMILKDSYEESYNYL